MDQKLLIQVLLIAYCRTNSLVNNRSKQSTAVTQDSLSSRQNNGIYFNSATPEVVFISFAQDDVKVDNNSICSMGY